MGISLTRDQVDQMACHAAQLEQWNRKINLTAITNPQDIAQKHFLDAIAVLPYMDQGNNHQKKIVDMGSGGGFPGLPIKLLNPDMQMVLVDASRKKVHFLKHVIRMLGIKGITAVHCRVEALHQDPDFAGRFDGVLARGFAGLESLAQLAAPLVTPAGTIYALKGPGAKAESTPDLESRFNIQYDWYTLPFTGGERCLVRLSSIKKSS
ncbi:MAG: 16S rRNA (guanine(527)-N(7))-methyltransferase RsmG [Desulfobacteraceae bacterium]|nr:16S rRNA (guanine(527)-N(7))-methyltransferase RsmG [Desulfobacteraceae bacterium]